MIQLNLVGPALQVGKTLANEVRYAIIISSFFPARSNLIQQVHRQVESRLREHFAQPIAAQPVPARNATRSSIDDEDYEPRRDQHRYRANSRDFATL